MDFADVDGDGDPDGAVAIGGDFGAQQNALWINRGFETGGTPGFFADRTATQFPALLDSSRDLEFLDLDGDLDADIRISNSSYAGSSEASRWWINMGGAQGGTPGFYQDQTSSRWLAIGVNDGVSHFSSIAPSQALASGGFVDWSCDSVLGDLDSDGDMDIFHATYGPAFSATVPSRIFLNDGHGFFEEFNPSHVQLAAGSIPDGTPGLWCEGLQSQNTTSSNGVRCDIADSPLGVELGDVDGDLDIDMLQGARDQKPRLYRNQLAEAGSFVALRDVTYASGYPPLINFGHGMYEQELGDLDGDDDLDIYGVNWSMGFVDATLHNDGTGVFQGLTLMPGSQSDDNDLELLDYDNDGELDVYVINFSGQDRLYRNDGAPAWTHTNVTASELPVLTNTGLGGDSFDVDKDGDYDLVIGNEGNQHEYMVENVNQIVDAIAPRIARVEQAADRAASLASTVVRSQIYDNVSWDVLRYDTVTLEYSWNGGTEWHGSPMRYSGGQIFRGEIRGDIAGTILCRVRASDEHGNTGVSASKSYLATGCTGNVLAYCTAGTTSNGCTATLSTSGAPTLGAASGFVITASDVEGQRTGLVYYGTGGRNAAHWGSGTSFACVKSPTQRTLASNSGGTSGACDGVIALDWLAFAATHPNALGAPFAAGQVIDAQCWFRDPPAPKSTSLSNAVEFELCP